MDEKIEKIRSEEEIKAKILELKKGIGFKHSSANKEPIRIKIETLKWVIKERERI